MEQGIDVAALLRALRKRWWLVALPVVLIGPAAAAVAYLLPPVYTATARVLVESQQIREDLAQTTVTSGTAERIALIRQRLQTRENLLAINDRFRVFADRPDMSPSDVVAAMRLSMTIEGVRFTGRRGPVTGVNIAFSSSRPGVAADVANELLNLLLEQNLQSRSAQAGQTLGFFNAEVERLSRDLEAMERRIAQFKIDNRDALPESLSFRRAELTALEQRQFEREQRRSQLTDQRAALEQALLEGDYAGVGGRPLSPEEQEVQRLRNQLVQARSLYSESHPRVRSFVARISALEQTIAASAETETESGPAAQTRRAIADIDAELAAIVERRRAEEQRMAALAASIERTPSVELALNALEREYGALQTQHRQAISKEAQAAIGERLEVNQQAERFEVIEQAQRPVRPVAPNRPLIAAAGFGGGLALGIGLVVLLELLNRTIRSPGDLERRVQLRPLVTVPYFRDPRAASVARWGWRGVALATAVGAPLGLYLVDRHYLPLPVLYERALDATGIAVLAQRLGGG